MSGEPRPLAAKLSREEAARLYDRLAGVYDIWGRLTETRARNRALALADVRNGQALIEVAVGTGLAFEELVRRNPDGRNLGIDISQGMLARAERRLRAAGLSNYQLSVGSASSIDAPDDAFDLILNNYMFDLLAESEWPVVLAEFRRVLRKGGKLVLVNMTVGEKPGSGIYERLYRISPSLLGGCRALRFSGVLERNGFAVHSREYVQEFLFPSEVILAWK